MAKLRNNLEDIFDRLKLKNTFNANDISANLSASQVPADPNFYLSRSDISRIDIESRSDISRFDLE
jgi:hypothetical protein